MASKNNPARRGAQNREKQYQGKTVKPVLYVGSHVGHGRYVAAQSEDGKLVTDRAGRPIPYGQI